MRALVDWASARGRGRDLGVNETFAVDGGESVRLLVAGEIDLFVVEPSPGGGAGARRHLMSATAPALICGLGTGSGSAGVVAVSRGATVVEMATGPDQPIPEPVRPGLVRLVDGWIMATAAGLVRDVAPRSRLVETLVPGAAQSLAAGYLACSARGVVWASVTRGQARFLGMQSLAGGTDAAVPLTPESWLNGEDVLTIDAVDSSGLMRQPGWWGSVRAYHRLLLVVLSRRIGERRENEARRLAARAARTAEGMDGALSKMARLAGAFERAPVAQDADNALTEACLIAFAPLGRTVKPPADIKRRRESAPPPTVEEIARQARVRPRQIALRGDWWRQDNGPIVAFAEEDRRPIALVPVSATAYVAEDVMRGTRTALTAELADSLEPLAWTFFAPLPDGKLGVGELLRFGLGRQWRDIAAVLAAGAVGGILALAVPVATGLLFQHAIPGHHGAQVVQIGLALVMVAAVATIVKLTGDMGLLRIEGKTAGQLQAGMIDRLLRLPSGFFNSYSTGDLAQRVLSVEMVRRAVTGLVLSSLLSGVFSLASFALLFWYQPMAALAAGSLLVILLSVSVAAGLAQLRAIMEGEQLAGNINALTLQMIAGMQKLRTAGAEGRAFVQWSTLFAEMRARLVRSRKVVNLYSVFMAGWEVLALAAVFLVMALAVGEDLETGPFLAFVSAFTMFMAAIGQMARAVMQCYAVVPMVRRAKPLLDAMPEVDVTKAQPGPLSGEIEVNHVFFRYDRDGPRALNGMTLQARPGEFVALVGPSGCGKSTLMKLLLGFERPEAGGVFFDGRDLRTMDVQAVRRQIGVVLQSGRVMPGSIYDNIKGATHASVAEAWDAAAMAGLDGDIRAMPMGMHTVLTEGSAALSGGQVQRLLIARALIGKPRIVLFDEATSALDNQTQSVVTQSLSRLSVTRVVIAHRLSTVKEADRIYVMEDGRVVEVGNFPQLMAKNGAFARLAQRQLA